MSNISKYKPNTPSNPISPKLLEGMKDFVYAITKYQIENNIIKNEPDAIQNSLERGLLDNAGMISKCVGNFDTVVIRLDDEKI